MPHPSRRLDLQLVPLGADASSRVQRAFDDLIAREVIGADGWAGPRAAWLVERRFVRVRSDLGEAPRLWANQQGGFRATCPGCGESVIRQLHRVVSGRASEPIACERCGRHSAIDEVDFRPSAAWGPSALVLHDVGTAGLSAEGRTWADDVLGAHKPVLRRP